MNNKTENKNGFSFQSNTLLPKFDFSKHDLQIKNFHSQYSSLKPIQTYIEDGCYKWTFDAPKVKRYVEINCQGKILNLFAGKNRLSLKEIRVDISNEFYPDFNVSAENFIELAQEKNWTFDTIIYDPPWNERKSKEFYNGKYIGKFTKLKDGIVSLLHDHGIIISLGYEITNFGKARGMKLTKLADVDPKGEIRPYYIAIEQKSLTLDNFFLKKRRKTNV